MSFSTARSTTQRNLIWKNKVRRNQHEIHTGEQGKNGEGEWRDEARKEGRGMEGRKVKTERWEGEEERKNQCHMGTKGTFWCSFWDMGQMKPKWTDSK